jgi:hypothetical protein
MGFKPQNIWRNTRYLICKHNPNFMKEVHAILNYGNQSAKPTVTISLISHDMGINIHSLPNLSENKRQRLN